MFHTPNIDATRIQAEAMGIPYISWDTAGEKERELDDLKQAMSYARDAFSLDGIVTGAIESVYQAVRVQKICAELGMCCFNPLWQTDQLEYLGRLLDDGFETVIVGVYAYPLEERWVGRTMDAGCIRELALLEEKYRINPSGEGGELETFVIDGPLFEKRIRIVSSHCSYDNYAGALEIGSMELEDK